MRIGEVNPKMATVQSLVTVALDDLWAPEFKRDQSKRLIANYLRTSFGNAQSVDGMVALLLALADLTAGIVNCAALQLDADSPNEYLANYYLDVESLIDAYDLDSDSFSYTKASAKWICGEEDYDEYEDDDEDPHPPDPIGS